MDQCSHLHHRTPVLKMAGSPHLQQAGPGLPAAPVAEGWPRDWWREEKKEDRAAAPALSATLPRVPNRFPWKTILRCGV